MRVWLGQSTTGTGIAAVLAALAAVASGAATWQQVVPLLVGGLAGVIWPENTALKTTAEERPLSIARLVAAYRDGLHQDISPAAIPITETGSKIAAAGSPEAGYRNMNRRVFLASASAVAVSRCTTPEQSAAPTLAQAQVWAADLINGLAVVGMQLIAQGAISGPNAATLSLVIDLAGAALTAFTSLQPGHTSTTAVAADVVAAIEKLVPLLPTQPELAAAIDVGLAVLAAFMQTTPMNVPAVPTALRRVAMLHRASADARQHEAGAVLSTPSSRRPHVGQVHFQIARSSPRDRLVARNCAGLLGHVSQR